MLVKSCSRCGITKSIDAFRLRRDNGKPRGECRVCERERMVPKVPQVPKVTQEPVTIRDPSNPKDAKEISMKRMLAGAKQRAKEKGLMFNLHYDDIQTPNLCPVLRIPLIPSIDGTYSDNSPSLDRKVPYLGYVKGNVKVISMRANALKSNATSAELEAVLKYVRQIEEENI